MVQRKHFRGRLEDNTPNPVDIHVGARVRLRRQILRLTQTQLAQKLGLTFQQVQKYEKGLNRIGSSRLWDIAQVLNVSTDFFFEDIDARTAALSPRDKSGNEQFNVALTDPLFSDEALTLVRNFYKISNRTAAQHLFNAIAEIAKSNSTADNDVTDDYV